jgi:hypothetical protein
MEETKIEAAPIEAPVLIEPQITKKQAIAMLWYKGLISYKLDPCQKDLYDSFHNIKAKTIVWSCSRRLGKSFCLLILALERCLQKPRCVIKFIAPTQKHVKTIIRPLMLDILKDCPKDLRPEFRTADNIYRFPNGSEIQMAGTDGGYVEGLRGGSSDICIVDEAGFCDNLNYIVKSILIPTTTTTRGKIILSSTPPISPDHDFEEYRRVAEFKGNYVKKTIYDCIGPRITQEILDEIIEELGGVESIEFRREYLCEQLRDENYSVVPEFTEELQAEVIKDWPKPAFYDAYVSGDIGFKDLTVFLFAYYDFKNARIVIEDELVMSGKKMTTDYMAAQVKAKESGLWINAVSKEAQAPYLRVCDNNMIVVNDLQEMHGLNFLPTQKDDAEAALNNVRVMMNERRIIIHPRCKTLIYHLRTATWRSNRKSYRRSADAGHYDAVDALKYLVRNVVYSKNPFPAGYGMGSKDYWFDPITPVKKETVVETQIKKIFTPRTFNRLAKTRY